MFLSSLPLALVVAAALLEYLKLPQPRITTPLGLGWAVAEYMALQLVAGFHCPNCGRKFHGERVKMNLLSNTCVYCNLKL